MRYARGLAVLATPPASAPSHADAANQNTTSGTPSDSSAISPFDINSHFSPTMIIILVILLAAFFFMGFFAVYVRRCTAEESISRRGSSRRTARQAELNLGSGVDPLLVESYPTVSYVAAKKKGCNECVVCLGDFEGGEELKQLPKCKHVFHPACIGLWLESHTTCPLCRRSLVNADRWSVSFRWGGSSRGASTRLTGEENSRSRRGGVSPWLGRVGSSTGSWLSRAAGRNEDGEREDRSSHGGAREETSIRGSPSCELEQPTSLPSSSQHGLPASSPLSEVAAPAEVAPCGLPASRLSSELVPRGLGKQASSSDLMPREIQECCEVIPPGSEVAARGLHVSNAASEVAQSLQVGSRKPRQTAALQCIGRSNSTGHSLRRRAALQVTGCMPFSLDRSRSVGVDGLEEEETMVGPACATSEHGPLSGSRCSSQIPHEACHVATSAPFPPPP